MKAKRVRTRQDLADFIELAPQLAAQRGDSEHYVPLFTSDIKEWFAHRGWFSEPVELWLILDTAGRAVARTICHRSPELAQKIAVSDPEPSAAGHAPTTLFFGAIEAADEAALDHLIAFLTTRARELAAERLFGPVSPLPNVTGGLLLSGTEHPGFFDSAWNPAFFAPSFHSAGFADWGRAHTWEVEVGSIPAARATAVSESEWAQHGLRRRRVSRTGLRAFARRLLPTLNAAFAQLPYYTQISRAQLQSQMAGLPALMDPALVLDIVGSDEPEAAPSRCFTLVIPDPVPILRRHGGRLGPRAILDLVINRRRLRDAVLIIQGTDPRFQGQGLLSLVIRDLNAGLAAGGYQRLRVTFIAEDNPASAAVFEKSGGRVLHELAFLDRYLTSDSTPVPLEEHGR